MHPTGSGSGAGHTNLKRRSLKKRNGEIDPDGYKVMREVALRRMEEDLITEEAMNEAIKSSGGILTEFIRIIRGAANIANMENRKRIEKRDVERVVTDIRNDYIRILNKEDIKIKRGGENKRENR